MAVEWPAHLGGRACGTITEGEALLLLCTYAQHGLTAQKYGECSL